MLEIETEFLIEIVVRCSTKAWALPIFQRSVTGYIEIAVIVLRLILVDSVRIFQNED